MIEFLTEFFLQYGRFLTVVILSLMPLIELRGALPVAVFALDYEPLTALLIAYPASVLPAPFIILLIRRIFEFLDRFRVFQKINAKILARTESKHAAKIERYGLLGLFIIVAIPLPGTGVWSGSLAAAVFRLPFFKALFVILAGNLVAALVITLITFLI